MSLFYFFSIVTANERLNPDTGKLGMSYSKFKRKDLSKLGDLILSVMLSNLCFLDCQTNWSENGAKYLSIRMLILGNIYLLFIGICKITAYK